MQIVQRLAVSVVVQAIAQFVQARELGVIEIERLGGTDGRCHQIVTERRNHCPQAVPARQMPIDDETGAHIGRSVDVRGEPRVLRYHARRVMIEILATHAACEQLRQRRRVGFERDVEHRDRIARLRIDALQQLDVALDTGDALGIPWCRHSQLMQRAQTVGIAVENIVVFAQCCLIRNRIPMQARRHARRLTPWPPPRIRGMCSCYRSHWR